MVIWDNAVQSLGALGDFGLGLSAGNVTWSEICPAAAGMEHKPEKLLYFKFYLVSPQIIFQSVGLCVHIVCLSVFAAGSTFLLFLQKWEPLGPGFKSLPEVHVCGVCLCHCMEKIIAILMKAAQILIFQLSTNQILDFYLFSS